VRLRQPAPSPLEREPADFQTYIAAAGGRGHELEAFRRWSDDRMAWRERHGPCVGDLVLFGDSASE
jgi:hypothetical protein